MAAAAEPAVLLEQVQDLAEAAPRLAFEKAAQIRDPILRERLRRDAYLALARSRPREAAAVLADVIDARWLPHLHFAQALDIAEFTVRPQPALTRRLLLATAARHPEAALREERQYIELPYGPEIRDAARHALPATPPELTLLRLRQNPGSVLLTPLETIQLAAAARTEEERETAIQLLRSLAWDAPAVLQSSPSALRAALALCSGAGFFPTVPASVAARALAGIDDAEDPVAEAARAATLLPFVPPVALDSLPASSIGDVLRTYRRAPAADVRLPASDLFPAGVSIQRYVFHNDDDGVESFESFLASYRGDAAWSIARTEAMVHLAGRGANGRRIEIFANVPVDLQAPANFSLREAAAARQNAVTRLLRERGLEPLVVVHRGHDHHFPHTRRLLRPSARLVFLGSCRGMESVEDVVTRCRRAQMIATRGTGTTAVNDTFLRALNRRLLEGAESIDWDAFWASLEPAMGGNGRFRDYVPPHRNEAALFLAAWYRRALAAP
jgi:hypothetical protein